MSIVDGAFIIDLDEADDAEGILDLRSIAGFSLQIDFGDITGDLELHARNHERMPWEEVTDVTITQPAGTAGSQLVEIGNARSRYYRVAYDHTSGTEHLRVCVHAKGD
jgi:hypothetical protein